MSNTTALDEELGLEEFDFQNNPNLRPMGVDISYTKEMLEEYMKCANDPIYFIENYVNVVHPDRGVVQMKLYEYQKRMISGYHDNRFCLGLTARQMGKTATAAAYFVWFIIFNNNKSVAILANKQATADEIMDRIRLAYEHLPKWIQSGVKKWASRSVHLENGSKIFCAATSSSGVRGKTINVLYVDEIAFVQNNLAEEFFTSVYPTIIASKDSKVIMTSTPNGFNHFYKFWNEAEKGLNGFTPIRCHWHEMPGRDDEWYKTQVEILGELKAAQEIDACLGGEQEVTVRIDGQVKKMTLEMLHQEMEKLQELNLHNKEHKIEIMTPSGWQEFDGVGKFNKQSYKLHLSNSKTVVASYNHRFIVNGEEIRCDSLNVNDKISDDLHITKIENIGNQDVYDVLNVANGSIYYNDNNIISHNSFLGSSRQLLTSSTMARLSASVPVADIGEGLRKGLKVYNEPIEGHMYTMTVDVSRGRHLDASAFMVFDVSEYPHRIVATYNNNEIAPLQYAGVVYDLSKRYNEAYVLIEINDVGAQIAAEMYYTYEYENLYWTKSGESLGRKGPDPFPGIRTTKKTKRIGCANLKDIIEKQQLIVDDQLAIQELSTFIQNDAGTWEADEGFHDDAVACLWLFAWLVMQPWFVELTDKSMRNTMYSKLEKELEDDVLPIFHQDSRDFIDSDDPDVLGLELL